MIVAPAFIVDTVWTDRARRSWALANALAAVLIGAVAAVMLGGCAGGQRAENPGGFPRFASDRPESVALASSEVVAFDRSPAGVPETSRFEFSRRDAEVGAAERGPILATRQWPQEPQPVERRIIFSNWQQR
ncbi:MAG: hypothetical protein IBJ11_07105 [Phycisphaerales bacterium]|nr:hypothetical protein [Phycisphaerales bacterium]